MGRCKPEKETGQPHGSPYFPAFWPKSKPVGLLLVAHIFRTLTTFVLIHLQTTLLFEASHR